MAILVPGGAGYIGSHTVYELIEAGRDVVVVDNLQTGFRDSVHPKAKFCQADIRDEEALNNIFRTEPIEAVIHFAACSQVGESMSEPLKYYDNNLYGTMVLLRSMLKNEVNIIVFSSTAATYGEPEEVPIKESFPTNPENCYGETKLAMERMMHWCSKAYGLKYIALRYFNACGAHPSGDIGEYHVPESHLIPLILQVPNGQRPHISIYGDDYDTPDGTCIRDYIHVTDLAQAHIQAVDYLLGGGKSDVFNLGNGVGFSVKEVIECARKVTGHEIPEVVAPRRPGDPARLVASSEKAVRTLGWKPQYNDLETIISTAWNWHKSKPNGFER
ncbi:MAG: UDP-glucose 4-epimerase GalE [Eubacteriales bacterium]